MVDVQATMMPQPGAEEAMFKAQKEEFLEGMESENEATRAFTIKQIGDLGYIDAELAAKVADMLGDGSTKVKEAALLTLGKMGEEGAIFANKVADMLNSRDPEVTCAACQSLGLLGPAATFLTDRLVKLFDHQNVVIRAAALKAVGEGMSSMYVHEVIKCLDDASSQVVAGAVSALGNFGTDVSAATEKVAGLLSSQDKDIKIAALDFFAKTGEDGKKLPSGICQCLADEDILVRQAAVAVFEAWAEEAGSLAKDVAAVVTGKYGYGKCAAAVALSYMGEQAAAHAAAVSKLLDDDFEDTASAKLWASCTMAKPKASMRRAKCAAAACLMSMGAAGAKFAGEVAQLLTEAEAEVRESAVQALGEMGAEGAKYEMQALKLLDDKDTLVVAAAALAVGEMGKATGKPGKGAIAAVASKLKSQHPCIRNNAVRALGLMGDGSLQHIAGILKCFGDRTSMVRCTAIEALVELGTKAQVYAADVARMMYDADPKVRATAIYALSNMGERGASFAEEIAENLEDDDPDVRAAASMALGEAGAEALPLMGVLQEMAISDGDDYVREAADKAYDKLNS
eukprot:gnl/TRDRNA2_/TRDRNA2_188850_c0_seq1.p1 gnl/TRDRNA2_/TRDRNA2_188850_c0~~gnl/TRDRNA2_/TRDRNA2_188850_c0_seq1.p1  ORF type:complete len:590 (+),score=170.40 gnl/TRDRNA2_/TRDRNA2_188850_c0_seq1:63-1772(+)